MYIKKYLENFNEWLFSWCEAGFGLLIAGLILVLGLCVVGVSYAAYQSAVGEKIELQKTDWTCTATNPHVSVIYVESDKVLVPIETRVDECINYQRNYK